MSKRARKRAKKREGTLSKLLAALERRAFVFSLAAALAIAALGAYVRLVPALKYGLELYEADPWEVYWLASYLHEHGLSSWFSLTQDNPVTKVFWYPWGRDFTTTEYPLLPMTAAATYGLAEHFGLTLREWVALLPVLAGVAAVLAGYFAARELAGNAAGVAAALLLALTPSAVERTFAGFAEKIGFSAPLILLSMLFFARFLKKRGLVSAAASGALAGLVAWSWGGWQAVQALTAATLALYPLCCSVDKKFLAGAALLASCAAAVTALSPAVAVAGALLGPSGVLAASVVLLALAKALEKAERPLARALKVSARAFYAVVLAAAAASLLAGVLLGVVHVSGRALFMLGLEKGPEDPLSASVAEHQALPAREVLRRVGGPLLLAVAFLPYAAYFSKKRPELLVAAVWGAFMAFAAFRSAYLLNMVASVLAVVGGCVAAYAGLFSRLEKRSGEDFRAAAAATLLVVLLLVAAAHGKTAMAFASASVPTIKSGGTNLAVVNYAWVEALDYIRESTPENSVVVAWWDYGYWISAYGQRASVADGATLNGTQIALLARALTAQSEDEALKIIFEDFKAPPNATYLVTFDVFRSYKTAEGLWLTGPMPFLSSGVEGRGDVPKSIWMLRIAGRLGINESQPYFVVKPVYLQNALYVVQGPNWESDVVQNTLLYKLIIYGASSMGWAAEGKCTNLTGTHIFVDWPSLVGGNVTGIVAQEPQHFKLVKVFVDCIVDNPQEKVYVAVFLYKVELASSAEGSSE